MNGARNMKFITTDLINSYYELKNKMDAAYKVFRKDPSITNATKHTEASNNYKAFCVDTLASLVGDVPKDKEALEEEIIANIDEYKTCKQCGRNLLYPVSPGSYIASSDFVEEFPGWCHDCLIEHCINCDCSECTLTETPATCAYLATKKFYQTEE
jgi:hypothetical protein